MAIEKVQYLECADAHVNPDRIITTIFSGDIPDFSPTQIRVIKFSRAAKLGNHWREYPELYGIIGQAEFTLEDVDAKERKVYSLKTGDRLLVPPRVALNIQSNQDTIITTCSQSADREKQTHKYEVN